VPGDIAELEVAVPLTEVAGERYAVANMGAIDHGRGISVHSLNPPNLYKALSRSSALLSVLSRLAKQKRMMPESWGRL